MAKPRFGVSSPVPRGNDGTIDAWRKRGSETCHARWGRSGEKVVTPRREEIDRLAFVLAPRIAAMSPRLSRPTM